MTNINYEQIADIMAKLDGILMFFTPNPQPFKALPEYIRMWYITECRTRKKSVESADELQELFKCDDQNGGYEIYYPSTRAILFEGSGPKYPETNPVVEAVIKKNRDTILKQEIQAYIERVLADINLVPLSLSSTYEERTQTFILTARGVLGETIKIMVDSDENTNIYIQKEGKALYTNLRTKMHSHQYDTTITIQDEEEQQPTRERFSFREIKTGDIKHSHNESVSITHDYVRSKCEVCGNIYSADGVYFFYTTNEHPQSFVINYYNPETINLVLSQQFEQNSELYPVSEFIKQNIPAQVLASSFCKDLENNGILPQKSISITCNNAELQEYANDAYRDPGALMENLMKKHAQKQ